MGDMGDDLQAASVEELRQRIRRAVLVSVVGSASDAVQLMLAELEGEQQEETDRILKFPEETKAAHRDTF